MQPPFVPNMHTPPFIKEMSPYIFSQVFDVPLMASYEDIVHPETGLLDYMLSSETRDRIVDAALATTPVPAPSSERVLTPPLPPIMTPPHVAAAPHVMTPPSVERPMSHPIEFTPKKPDSLFWSIYVAHYGVDSFFAIDNKYMNAEIEEKQQVVDFMKSNRPILKSLKITLAATEEIAGDLMTNRETVFTMLPVIAAYYNCTMWLVSMATGTYMEFLPGGARDTDDDPGRHYVIYRTKGDRRAQYSVDMRTDEARVANIDRIRGDFLRLEGSGKWLRGVSSYKVGELQEMAEKLKLDVAATKCKKEDLYVAITRHCEVGWL